MELKNSKRLLLYGKVNPSVLIGSFLVRITPYDGPFPWKAGKFKSSMARVPYNKLFTNLASSSPTGEYWPSVVFVRALGPYCDDLWPIFSSLPSHSVSKRLLIRVRLFC